MLSYPNAFWNASFGSPHNQLVSPALAFASRPMYCEYVGIDIRVEPELIQPNAVLPLAFGRVPLDQPQVHQARPEEACMYLPISLGGVLMIVLVLWLVGVV